MTVLDAIKYIRELDMFSAWLTDITTTPANSHNEEFIEFGKNLVRQEISRIHNMEVKAE